MNGFLPIPDGQDLLPEAPSLAVLARDVEIVEKVHLEFFVAVPLTMLAPASRDIE